MGMVRGTGFEPVTPTVSRAALYAVSLAFPKERLLGAVLGAGFGGSLRGFLRLDGSRSRGAERHQRAGLAAAAQRSRAAAGLQRGHQHAGAEQGHPDQRRGRPQHRARDQGEKPEQDEAHCRDGPAVGIARPARGVAARADVRGSAVDAQRWRLGGFGGWLGLRWWFGPPGRRVTPVVAAGAALGEKRVETGVLSCQTPWTGYGSGWFQSISRFEVTGCTVSDGKRPKKKTLARVRAKIRRACAQALRRRMCEGLPYYGRLPSEVVHPVNSKPFFGAVIASAADLFGLDGAVVPPLATHNRRSTAFNTASLSDSSA